MTRYVIIGNGAAGTEAAANIRKNDPDSPLTMITESRFLHYYRPKLVHFLAEEQSPDGLVIYDDAWYRERDICNVLGRKIVSIDTEKKTVTDWVGTIYPYDKLLLASGSKPFVPPVPGIERPGVFTLRSVTDANRIKKYSADVNDVLVIGGGLLGLENANSLLQLGKKVTVVEFAPWLLPRQLDREGGEHLQKLLEAKGLHFILNDQVSALEGDGTDGAVNQVRLKSGTVVPVGAVLVSAGVRGDMDFLKGSPIAVNRGVVVDDTLQTSVPDIWAAGDLAEHRGISYGLWTVAKEQGKVAGLGMSGIPVSYTGSLPSSILKITGINVFSMGDVSFGVGEASLGREAGDLSDILTSSNSQSYRKMVLDSAGTPRSAMVVGDKSAIQTAQKVMSGKSTVEEFRKLVKE